MRVITLGTSAGRPTLERASPAMALDYEGETLLFDCGEGTQIQLMKSPLKWLKLKAIFITHVHGDHFNGLVGVLGTLALSGREAPLWLFGPSGLKEYIDLLCRLKNLWIPFPLHLEEIRFAGSLLEADGYEVFTEPLRHVIECWGFRFQEKPRRGKFDEAKAEASGIPFGPLRGRLAKGEVIEVGGRSFHPGDFVGPVRPGRSVAYCCDTEPCEASIRLGQEADLLVHESTFDHSMAAEIKEWGHSTSVQAAEIARDAKAKKLILTHISPRYIEAGLLLQQAREVFKNAELAEDLREYTIVQN